MKSDTIYINLIDELKQNILKSRYTAIRLANKEQLTLYYKVGSMLHEKITAEKWGTKVLEQIASDLQQALPGLRGFSFRNLQKMQQFHKAYSPLQIMPSSTAQLPTSTLREQSTNEQARGIA